MFSDYENQKSVFGIKKNFMHETKREKKKTLVRTIIKRTAAKLSVAKYCDFCFAVGQKRKKYI